MIGNPLFVRPIDIFGAEGAAGVGMVAAGAGGAIGLMSGKPERVLSLGLFSLSFAMLFLGCCTNYRLIGQSMRFSR
jgi:hypothetical protein